MRAINIIGGVLSRRQPLEDRERHLFKVMHGGMTKEEWEAKKAEYQAEYDAQCKKDKAAYARRITRERKRKAEMQARAPEWARGDGWEYEDGNRYLPSAAKHKDGVEIDSNGMLWAGEPDSCFECEGKSQGLDFGTPENARVVADFILARLAK